MACLNTKKDITYLKEDYNNILDSNKDFLNRVRIANNIYKHKMHRIRLQSHSSGSDGDFSVGFDIKKVELIDMESQELKQLIKALNVLFAKIMTEVKKWMEENNKTNNHYYNKILIFDFKYFNEIYDNSLLGKIGRVMYEY